MKSTMLAILSRILFPTLLLGLALPSAFCEEQTSKPTSEQLEFFENNIRPVLVKECYTCHSATAKKLKAGLYLDSRAALLKGGESGTALVPGKPEESLLIEALRHEGFEMPPRKKLPPKQIDDFVKWIELGAPWTPGGKVKVPDKLVFDWKSRKKTHWSWKPLSTPSLPTVAQKDWPINPIDSFILARLEQQKLSPATNADKRTLIRRITFDLIGLPPSKTEVENFLQDHSPNAYERVVDRLLNSKHFGEKWGRHWLDLVRYAESHGHEFDYPIHHAHQYRDYVIRAFNEDVPYDQFVREHLAGDLLSHPRKRPETGTNESVLGTGFWFFGEATHSPTDVRKDEADRIDNQINVFGKTFLGLSIGCARCHDHKFDPIPTEDYYAIAGFLQSSRKQDVLLDPDGNIARSATQIQKLQNEANSLLAEQLRSRSFTKTEFAKHLLATRDALRMSDPTGKSRKVPSIEILQQVAKQHEVEVDSLTAWVQGFQSKALKDMAHPLYIWNELISVLDENFASKMATIRKQLKDRIAKANQERESLVNLSNFDDSDWQGWLTTGEAFGSGPLQQWQWNTNSPWNSNTTGIASSRRFGEKFQGVLRSPTFKLTSPNIYFRMNAKNATVRLIIDGYQMEVFNGLLFGGTRLTGRGAETNGSFQWKRLGNAMYLDHTAYLEFIDHGNGYVELDEVVLGNRVPSTPEMGRETSSLLKFEKLQTPQQLASALGEVWEVSAKEKTGSLHAFPLQMLLNEKTTPKSKWHQELSSLQQQQDKIHQALPNPQYALGITDGTGEDELVFIRGSHIKLGEKVPRRLLLAIAGEDQPPISHGSGRLELADRLLDRNNPFPSRVMVNRIWHHLFGRGIVSTVDDFGEMGIPPSHPRLLDWLANDFIKHDWSVKYAIRQMVLSHTYRMASLHHPAKNKAHELDPTNTLLHRMPVKRLTAESIRDAMLTISGRLNRTVYGPSTPVHLTEFMQGRGRPASGPLDGNGRRSLYLAIKRNFLSPMMLTFDFPIPFNTMGRRSTSNVPAQALILMNDPFVMDQASRWAKKSLAEENSSEKRIVNLFEEAFAVPPSKSQREFIHSFVQQQAQLYKTNENDLRVWTDVCHILFNMKQFIYLN